MKIAFCGDSFCSETWKDTWCGIVAKHFAASIIPLGQNGSNEYAILQRFKKLISKNIIPELTIFCHTDPYRLPNLENLPLGSRCAEPPDPLTPVWETSYNYYDHVINYGFHELSHLAIVNEIMRLCSHHQLKALHLRSFVPADNGVGFREYDWNPNMDNSIATSLESISKKYGEPDIANHLNLEGNKHVAELVIDKIESLKLL